MSKFLFKMNFEANAKDIFLKSKIGDLLKSRNMIAQFIGQTHSKNAI